ncbi:MAG: ubiquinone/menaquinone biosynthesis C-methylase UbiE [Hyphomicrobiaceae bacterium]|jgi:ubiquinone/menaquinone biosynthesis C-methylase UbiE
MGWLARLFPPTIGDMLLSAHLATPGRVFRGSRLILVPLFAGVFWLALAAPAFADRAIEEATDSVPSEQQHRHQNDHGHDEKSQLKQDSSASLFEPTSHRRFDDPERWSKIFDDPARDDWQQPRRLLAALGIREGQKVADLGAGTGYFETPLGQAVGPTGTIYAVEVEPNLIVHLRERAEREGLGNVVPILASGDNPRLPRQGVDWVLVVDTFHHLPDRRVYFGHIATALAPQGRVAVVDWRKMELPIGPPVDHKLGRSQVVREMQLAGFALVDEHDFLEYQYVLVFEPV